MALKIPADTPKKTGEAEETPATQVALRVLYLERGAWTAPDHARLRLRLPREVPEASAARGQLADDPRRMRRVIETRQQAH